ncbi:DNA-processing protein DprA [Nakamurella endophytica]|uniref:DNA processing protein DprA n=1 Tax=Nakamurella endophytica TaxID=1748367 RepID=A0A917WCR8_9ACTN|nr:DNA-processing protein DprA [Nakamurella endophytica]GGL90475.1 DNA processing protein DprA [Nakamurella endophytica]
MTAAARERTVEADGPRVAGGGVDSEVRCARAALLRVAEPPAPAVLRLIDRRGPVDAWQRIRAGAVDDDVLSATAARLAGRSAGELGDLVAADLASAAAVGARLVVPEDPEWPAAAVSALRTRGPRAAGQRADPVALWVRGGSLSALPSDGITVVGSRASTPYGQRLATDLGHRVAAAGLTVVSGAAFGIDAAAHRGALAAAVPGTATVAVLACGIDQAYPVAHRELIEAVAAAGAVVSEYPPGTRPARHRFLVRNRLIAALGAGTVVVEAGRRSGTLSTACEAAELHRLVMALPGPVTSALSVGCHRLIADGAALLVTGADDVLSLLRPDRSAAQDGLWSIDEDRPTDGLDPEALRVYDALDPRRARTVADVAEDSGVPAPAVLSALGLLEVRALAARHGGGTWRRAG